MTYTVTDPAFPPDECSDNPPDSPYRKLDLYNTLEFWLLEGCRPLFDAYKFCYEYDEEKNCFRLVHSYYTYSYDTVLAGRFIIEDENNFGQHSLPQTPDFLMATDFYILENGLTVAWPYVSSSIYKFPLLIEQEQADAVEDLIRKNLHHIAAALDELGQMKKQNLLIFLMTIY